MGKDDNKPKRPVSAFEFFLRTCRKEHRKEVFSLEFKHRCSDRWKKMSEEEKSVFQKMSKESKKRYESKMADYNPPENNTKDGEAAKGGKRKQTEDPEAPKKSMSAFFWFLKDERPRVKESKLDSKVGNLAKEMGRRWREASADVRSKYKALAAEDKARYLKEVEEYKGKKVKLASPSEKNDSNESGKEEEKEEAKRDKRKTRKKKTRMTKMMNNLSLS